MQDALINACSAIRRLLPGLAQGFLSVRQPMRLKGISILPERTGDSSRYPFMEGISSV